MKRVQTFIAALLLTATAFAEAPKWGTDVSKTISAATKDKKLGFILMGREACGNCQATKRLVNDGKVPVTAETFVIADINVDDPKASAEFSKKFKKESFGSTLPFVVITDTKGKPLASYSGFKDSATLTAMIEEAKKKSAAAPK
jgi:thioredoxin-related protein